MGENIFINKKSFNLSSLEGKTLEDVEKSGKKAFIDIFKALDLNGDKVIDNSEVSIFLSKLKAADSDKNGKLDKDEMKALMKDDPSMFDGDVENKTDVKFRHIMKFFKKFTTDEPDNKKISPVKEQVEYDVARMSDNEVEYAAITSIEDEISRGYDALYGHQNGVAGGGTMLSRNSSAHAFHAALWPGIYISKMKPRSF